MKIWRVVVAGAEGCLTSEDDEANSVDTSLQARPVRLYLRSDKPNLGRRFETESWLKTRTKPKLVSDSVYSCRFGQAKRAASADQIDGSLQVVFYFRG